MKLREPWHGTAGGYTNHHCRCNDCREAWRAVNARRRAKRYAEVRHHGLPSTVPHGFSAYCNWGCRCDVCTTANSEYCKRRAEAEGQHA